VQISNFLTVIAMLIPFAHYSYVSCLSAFALLGIANTILQVSLNPLLSNVVEERYLTGALTTGQFVKAISSFSGPFIAAFAASRFGSWQSMFPVFAGITLISALWLQATPITESQSETKSSSFKEVLSLLGNRTILLLFLGILFVVGVDVGLNISTPRILMERCGISLEEAGYGTSVYFACRTAGAFIGAFILSRFSATAYFRISMIIAVSALIGLFFVTDEILILTLVGIVGFTCACVFSIIFSIALEKIPEKANEISGLMITGVSGGALMPLLMGVLTDFIGTQNGAVMVIAGCAFYLLLCSFFLKKAV
jgi:fucose permease